MSLDLQIAAGIIMFVVGLLMGTVRGWNACAARVLDVARGDCCLTIEKQRLYVVLESDCTVVEREEDMDQLAAE